MVGGSVGYVYIMSAEHTNGLKIGFTTTSIKQRETELNTTGVVSPLKAIYYCLVESPSDVERLVHKDLADFRISNNREFFQCEIDIAIAAINKSIEDLKLKKYDESIKIERKIESSAYDFSIWPRGVHDSMSQIIDEIEADFKKFEEILGIHQERVPTDSADINKILQWHLSKPSVLNYIDASVGRIEALVARYRIKYKCGNISIEEFNSHIEHLRTWIYESYGGRQRIILRQTKNKLPEILVNNLTEDICDEWSASGAMQCFKEGAEAINSMIESAEDELIFAQALRANSLVKASLTEEDRSNLLKSLKIIDKYSGDNFEKFKIDILKLAAELEILAESQSPGFVRAQLILIERGVNGEYHAKLLAAAARKFNESVVYPFIEGLNQRLVRLSNIGGYS